ncbi:MAG: polysaccharide deacetylase family protein [Bacteroidia bacterium]
MYHYIRNFRETEFKGLKGETENQFIKQIRYLDENFERATIEKIHDYLSGTYKPKKNLYVLTFDDGLKEHGNFVTEVLDKHQIEGQFFIPTMCIDEETVLPVHKNHFLLAYLGIRQYEAMFRLALLERYPAQDISIQDIIVQRTYRWDEIEVARFKYLINYKLPLSIRDEILDIVFQDVFDDEPSFSKSIYLNDLELKNMRSAGMVIGGHSHSHNVLSSLTKTEQSEDLHQNLALLKPYVSDQLLTPFSFPFGKKDTYNSHTLDILKQLNVSMAYSTIVEDSTEASSMYEIGRVDPKDIPAK